ncbi:GNAT family N-acetyltransferase [Methylobacterium nodulans]|uniref:GCN5-related N-acetyltransferase n=1 Tax=Methylobacterium nodulans (strain LMG 21967 / CNCM I-2342 / ORS 2060) TaxID=460265 RepID=B8IXI6_METNO|nr:GNAT family N-acetyltransferase [Methylobacterium nodulans]ACL62818.1 GCN5-related N-acetyltransferase [Methylobacterium nodulans ORS 2060]
MTQDASGKLTIRVMKRHDLGLAIDWAAAEGWNPGLKDADCFKAVDPTGFLVGCLGDEPIASISVVRYSSTFGFLGFYIVRPDQRGRGFGYRLWRAGIAYLEDRTVGLDGVVAQQDNYARSGFVLAHRNVRFGGSPQVEAPHDERLKLVGPDLIEAVLAYDRPFFAAPRETFLRCWLKPDTRTAVAFVEDGTVKGYGVIRACRSGYKIGPLFADSERGADLLFQALASQAKGSLVFLDLPEPNQAAVQLAASYGLSPVFETARMYRGERPDLPLARTYGISTFELG